MPASMTLTSTNGGLFTFADLPLISRGVAYMRRHPSVPTDRKKISVVLSGFFTGNTHAEIMDQYEALKAVVSDSKVAWVYNDGVSEIANGPVYIESYSEPSSWKQYEGDYRLTFSYYEKQSTPFPFVVSFVKTGGSPTLTFSPIPVWARVIKPNKMSTTGRTLTPAGENIGSEVTINLQGSIVDTSLSADDPAATSANVILAQQNTFEAALENFGTGVSGTLNYGPFSQTCYVESFGFAPGSLQDYTDYDIVLKYFTEAVMKLSATVSYDRIHNNPKIEERPYCGDRRITFGNVSGQVVNYSIKLWADSIVNARNLLADEVATLVAGGGIELPGGIELWNYDTASVAVTIKKFHDAYILANL